MLAPGAYRVFDESDFNPNPLNQGPDDFALSGASGDVVWLVIPDGNGTVQSFVDDLHFGASPNGESFGRVPDGSGRIAPMIINTLGSSNSAPRVGPAVISEMNYNPGVPSAAALDIDPNLTADDLEFVEVYNPTGGAIELANWRLAAGVDFDFASGTTLAAGETLLVVSFNPTRVDNANRLAAFRAHYGLDAGVRLVGGYGGQLSDNGEIIQLQRPDDPPLDQPNLIPRLLEDEVLYDDLAPWPVTADGSGQSLQRVSFSTYGNTADNWSAGTPTPGAVSVSVSADFNGDGRVDEADINLLCGGIQSNDAEFDLTNDGLVNQSDLTFLVENVLGTTAGDANLDGIFNPSDLVQVFQRGEYEDTIVGNSTWSDGDWNCDGEFSTTDLVLALQAGGYVAAASPAATWHVSSANEPAAGDIGAALIDTQVFDSKLHRASARLIGQDMARQPAVRPILLEQLVRDQLFAEYGQDVDEVDTAWVEELSFERTLSEKLAI